MAGIRKARKGRTMELQFLHMLQELHRDWLSAVMIFFTTIGEAGICWIVLSVILALFKKTRKCGFTMMAAMAVTFLVGNVFLKNLIARPRPCAVDTSVSLLIPFPSEYSFPSGHTSNGFTAAATVFLYYRKPGIAALIVAAVIAFSRMYLFVHYPTDILGGILLGVLDAILAVFLVRKWERYHKKESEKAVLRYGSVAEERKNELV